MKTRAQTKNQEELSKKETQLKQTKLEMIRSNRRPEDDDNTTISSKKVCLDSNRSVSNQLDSFSSSSRGLSNRPETRQQSKSEEMKREMIKMRLELKQELKEELEHELKQELTQVLRNSNSRFIELEKRVQKARKQA